MNKKQRLTLERMLKSAKRDKAHLNVGFIDDGYKYMYLTNTHWLVRFPRINDEWFSENTTNFIPVEQCEKIYATFVKTDDMRMIHLSLETLKEHLRNNRKSKVNKYTISDENNITVNAWYLRYMFDLVNSTYITCFYNMNKLTPLYLTDGKEFDILLCQLVTHK